MTNVQVIEKGSDHMVGYSMETRLFMDNIIKIDEEITQETANAIQSQLIYLINKLAGEPDAKITILINSPGGSVYDGLGIYDLIQKAQKEGIIVNTVNLGKACSMGSLLLMAGSPGYRESYPHARVMVHEASHYQYGKTSDLEDQMKEMKTLQNILNEIICRHASEKLTTDCLKTDLWMSAQEALDNNIIDKIKQIH